MKLTSLLVASLIASATFISTAQAENDKPAETQTEKPRMNPHSHTEEKMGIKAMKAPHKEEEQVESKKHRQDKKHLHPRDGK